jgi:hypothetical protein
MLLLIATGMVREMRARRFAKARLVDEGCFDERDRRIHRNSSLSEPIAGLKKEEKTQMIIE